eukprot:scaffold18256_cov17-Tisochrysis_lutea.AAC.2
MIPPKVAQALHACNPSCSLSAQKSSRVESCRPNQSSYKGPAQCLGGLLSYAKRPTKIQACACASHGPGSKVIMLTFWGCGCAKLTLSCVGCQMRSACSIGRTTCPQFLATGIIGWHMMHLMLSGQHSV